MKLSIKDDVLSVCQQIGVGSEYPAVEWSSVGRCFVHRIGTDSSLEISPGWHFPRGVPSASSNWAIHLRNKRFSKTYKSILGRVEPYVYRNGFHILDRDLLSLSRTVIERNGFVDLSPHRPQADKAIYLDDIAGWIAQCLEVGLSLAENHLDLRSDKGVLQSAQPPNEALAYRPPMILIEMMLGNRLSAQDFLARVVPDPANRFDEIAIAQVRALTVTTVSIPQV